MDSLDRAMELVTSWKADRQKPRADVLARLEAVVIWGAASGRDVADALFFAGPVWVCLAWSWTSRVAGKRLLPGAKRIRR